MSDAGTRLEWRRWRRMARQIAAQIPLRDDWQRACGECVCEICGLEYFDHPPTAAASQIHILCDGNQVKL